MRKLGVYGAASCGGCDLAVLEIDEHVAELAKAFDIAFWPTIADVKTSALEAMAPGEIDVCLFSGAIRTEENVRMAHLLREKSAILIAFGACAAFGGAPGLANLDSRADLLARVFGTESTDRTGGALPYGPALSDEHDRDLPSLEAVVRPLSTVASVDYTVPGCPPVAPRVLELCQCLIEQSLPPSPAVLGAGDASVCDECSLEKRGTHVERFHRMHEVDPDRELCLLEQGLLCLGPVTRSGCGGQCPSAFVPCRGCYGPVAGCDDQGAAMVSVLGTLAASDDASASGEALSTVVDPVGTFYCFSLPTSILGHARRAITPGEVDR